MVDQLLSGNISFAGLGSGTDFSALVEGLVKIEQRRITMLENWRKSWDDKITQFRDLNTKLLSLKSSLEGMSTPGKFLIKNAVSSSENAVSATAGPEAVAGSYMLDVIVTAKNHIMTSNRDSNDPISSADKDSITDGTDGIFTFTYGEKTISVSLGAGSTLNDLVNAINSHADNKSTTGSGIGVRASALKIAEGDYRLQLTGLDLGADNKITVISNLVDGLNTDAFGGDESEYNQTPKDAQFKLNGLTLTRSTNSINDVVPGLTFLLKDQGTGINITVKTDTEAIKENIQTFVESVNEVRTKINEISMVDTTTNEGSILTGNYGIQIISQNLKNIVAGLGIGFDYNDDLYSALPQIGILTNAEEGSANRGLLALDEDKLNRALAVDPDAVAKLFAADYVGSAIQPTFSYVSCPDTITPGTYAVEWNADTKTGTIDGYSATYREYSREVMAAPDGTVFYETVRELVCEDGPAKDLVIRINNPDLGSAKGLVTIIDSGNGPDGSITNYTDQSTFSYVSCLSGTTIAGTYEIRWDADGQEGTIGGHPATWDSSTKQLTGGAGTPVAGLVIRINDPTADITSGSIRLKIGKASELINEIMVLTDPKSGPKDFEAGPLAVLEENYRDIIASIDKKIEYEERRITRLTRQYKDRFARLDALLNHYSGISAGLQSQIISMMGES